MSKIKLITRTAILLALAIIFQNFRYFIGALPFSTYIIGSLVNLVIFIATGSVGLLSGIIVCLVTPIVALFQGHLPHFLLAPVTMLGNSVLAVTFYLFLKSKFSKPFNMLLGVIAGALIKWVFMYWFGIKVILKLFIPELPAQKAAVISASFNTPQIITALIGGLLAIIIIKMLKTDKT
ncbi:MAG: ECF transporter S component [Clostridiaceae bacterium]|nr:ECF transporter S component [Clostridiaceae bacterium]